MHQPNRHLVAWLTTLLVATLLLSSRGLAAAQDPVASITRQNEAHAESLLPTATEVPIIILPGVMGTALQNTPQAQPACQNLPRGLVWPSTMNTAILSLALDETGQNPAHACNQIDVAGLIDIVSPIGQQRDYYRSFIAELRAAGYTVLDYPGYDWRMDIHQSAAELDAYITTQAGDAAQVILIAHSMGGLLARAYVADSGRAARIAKIISIGAPYWGAPIMAFRMRTGHTGTPLDPLWQRATIQAIIRNAAGAAQLLPSEAYLQHAPYYMDNGTMLTHVAQTVAYFDRAGQNTPLLHAAQDLFHAQLDDFSQNNAFSGDYYILAAAHLPTTSLIREFPCGFTWLNTCIEPIEYNMGDETVPGISSRLGNLGDTMRGAAKICTYGPDAVGKGHSELLTDANIRTDIARILRDQEPDRCTREWEPAASAQAAIEGFRQIIIRGEIRVQVADEQGRITGVNDFNLIVNDLADVTYTLTRGGVILTMPTTAPYRLLIHQQGAQSMRLKFTDYALGQSNTGVDHYTAHARAIFEDIPSSAGRRGLMINAGAPLADLALALDTTGDGLYNAAYAPAAHLAEPSAAQDITIPTTTITVDGPQATPDIYTGPITVTLTAQDDNAGILGSYLSLDQGQSWQPYTTPVQLLEAIPTLWAYSIDKAGNLEWPPTVRSFHFAGESRLYLPAVSDRASE